VPTIKPAGKQVASCRCGKSVVTATAPLKARFICHCTFCQEFTGKAFSDVTVVNGGDLQLTCSDHITYAKWRRLPPSLARGRCAHCGDPIVERSGSGPLKTYFVPSAAFNDGTELPPVAMRAFYNRRVTDMPDNLPRHEGYWRSQIAIIRLIGVA
jgi:hypothetical protein